MEAIEKSGHAGKAPVESPWSLEVLLKKEKIRIEQFQHDFAMENI